MMNSTATTVSMVSQEVPNTIEIPFKIEDDKSLKIGEEKPKDFVRPRYVQNWEKNPILRDWVEPLENGTVNCRFCNCKLRAHHADLIKHSTTRKHQLHIGVDNIPPIKRSTRTRRGRPTIKTESLKESIVLIPSEDGPDEAFDDQMFGEYSETMETTDGTSELSNASLAKRIGQVLTADVRRLIQANRRDLVKSVGPNENLADARNIKKLAKVCAGILSQKYLVETAREAHRVNKARPKSNLQTKISSVEMKLLKTMSDMNMLKMKISGRSENTLSDGNLM